jgi:hypothetical protein
MIILMGDKSKKLHGQQRHRRDYTFDSCLSSTMNINLKSQKIAEVFKKLCQDSMCTMSLCANSS